MISIITFNTSYVTISQIIKINPFIPERRVVLVNSSNQDSYFSSNQFGRISLFTFSSFPWLINAHFLIIKWLILNVLCKEKLDIHKVPGAERVKEQQAI